jgi:hypothetical protein
MAPRKKRKMDALASSSPEVISPEQFAKPPANANISAGSGQGLVGNTFGQEGHHAATQGKQRFRMAWKFQKVSDAEQKRNSAPKETPTTSRRHTRGMTTDAARKAVLNTSELLESILVCLPPKTLFGVQRVSKQFQGIIATSIPIQEKMFLRLRNKPRQYWLLREQATVFRTNRYFVESASDHPGQNSRSPTDLNPFLSNHSRSTCAERARGKFAAERVRVRFDQPVSLNMLRTGVPSILKTYISDPPTEDVKVLYYYRLPTIGSIFVDQDKFEGAQNSGTIGNAIREALEGGGRAWMDLPLKGLNFDWQTDSDGAATHPNLVLEHYEKIFSPTTGFMSGIRHVDFSIRDMVAPTEAERAAVKSKGFEK